ncbi:MAG TPA: phage tail tape measure protein [Candidatus Eisenbergiella merdipullorum]|uniref:Phage tail tape measure protein n=1 Tax=Candidatus Eisenbergiella merdipullorum TaxID=2838553 RepID=A0A9D2L0Q1_9FIRM|nr:phage tail tape measure protein [Candidatus Eisenbergiella merdipullorum]
MAENNFLIKLIASLDKSQSTKQIKSDTKNLGDIYVKLIGSLDTSKTKTNIKNQLNGINTQIDIKPEVDSKKLKSAIEKTLKESQKIAEKQKINVKFETQTQKSSSFRNNNDALQGVRKQVTGLDTDLKNAGKTAESFGSGLTGSLKKYSQLLAETSFVYGIINQLRNAAEEAKTLDDSLVDLQKVTDEINDRDSLYQYLDKTIKHADELNVKVNSLIYAITEFKKLGWSLSDAEIGGKWATILENVGDVNIDTAIGSIKTAIASFEEIGGYGNDQMENKIEAYVDLINEMSNKYSIDAEGLAEAVRISAGTLTEAHTSIEEAVTMFATANRYYNDPSYLGNTAKISSLRMRASSDSDARQELEDLGESMDGVAQSASSLREKLLDLTGVDIMEANGQTFKSYYDQLYEISQVMDDLADVDRANVLETMFGKNRAAAGAALLSGMAESAEAYETAINSAGSATQEYETWMQGADAATQRFSNSLTKIYQSIINGNTVRDVANLGASVLDFANDWGLVEGTLRGVIALGIGKFLTNTSTALLSATKQVQLYGEALQTVRNMPSGEQHAEAIMRLGELTKSLTDAQLKQVLSSEALNKADQVRILMNSGLTREMAEQKLASLGLTQATNAQTAANTASTASTFSLKAALTGLGATIKSVFMSNPVGIALMGISVGVSAVTSAISSHNQKMDELREKTKTAAEEANTLGDEIADLAARYIQLSEAVKTDSSAKDSLMETQTELLQKLGLEGESIDELIKKYGSLSDAVNQLSIDSLKQSQIDLIAGVDTATEELIDAGKDGFWNSRNIINAMGDDAVKAFQELEKAGIINSNSYGSGGGQLVLIGDDTVEGALQNFDVLEKALQALRDSENFTGEELADNSLYQAIYARYSEMEEAVSSYDSAISNLNENLAQQTMLVALQGQEIPKSAEEFEQFKQSLIDTAIASKQFIGTDEDIANAINSYLSSVSDFQSFYTDEANKGAELADQVSSSFSTISQSISQINSQLKPQFDELADAYQEIFSEDGFSLDVVDNEMLENLRSSFEDIEDEVGVAFDTSEMEKFFSVLTNGESTAEEVQQAFNDLATAYLYSTDTMENLNDETAQAIEQQLQEMGVTNANEVVSAALAQQKLNLGVANLYAAQTGKSLENATAEEIVRFAAEQIEMGNLSQEMAQLLLQKASLNLTTIDTKADINNLIALAQTAGATAQTLDVLNAAKGRFGSTGSSNLDALRARKDVALGLNNAPELDVDYEPVKLDFSGAYSDAKKDAGKAGKETGDKYVEEYEKSLQKINDLYDREKLTEKQRLDAMLALARKYFADKAKYAEKYAELENEYLQGMKDLYQSVMSGIISRIDDQIDKLNDQKDAAVDALEAQKDAAVDALEAERDARKEVLEQQKEQLQTQIDLIQAQIDAKQDEIDAINDAADATKRQADLEKALYDQRRAQEQRVNKVYSGQDRGFIYEADTSSIREADEAVEDAQRDIRIANIEQEISVLEKRRDALEDQQDLIDKQIDELDEYYDKLISNTEAYYDDLIASTEASWDAIIQGFEETKSRWEELQDLEEQAEFEANLRELGLTLDDVLNMSENDFAAFKDNYLGILADIYAGNDKMISSMSELANVDMSALPGYLEETQQYIDTLSNGIDFSNLNDSLSSTITGFEDAAKAAGILTGAIVGGGGGSSGESGNSEGGKGKEGEGGSGDSVLGASEKAATEGVENITEFGNAFSSGDGDEGGDSAESKVNSLKASIAGGGSQEGSGEGSGESGSDSLMDAVTLQTEAALDEEAGIPAQIAKWGELDEVLDGIITKLDTIKDKLEELSTIEVTIPGISWGGFSHFAGTETGNSYGNSYSSGTKRGIPTREHNAMISEFGPEIAVYPNGTYKLFTEPSIVDLPQGTSIFNTKQTMDMLKKEKRISLGGTALFDGYDPKGIDNMRNLVSSRLADTINRSNFTDFETPESNQTTTVNLNGGIVLNGVQDVDGLARSIVQNLPLKMMQIMNKKEYRPRR